MNAERTADEHALGLILEGISHAISETASGKVSSIEYLPMDSALVCVEFAGISVAVTGLNHEQADRLRELDKGNEPPF